MSLNTNSRVNPTILKGSRIIHIKGSRNNMTNAIGQHSTNKIHQRIIAIIVFIILLTFHKRHANLISADFKAIAWLRCSKLFGIVHWDGHKRTGELSDRGEFRLVRPNNLSSKVPKLTREIMPVHCGQDRHRHWPALHPSGKLLWLRLVTEQKGFLPFGGQYSYPFDEV